MIPPHKSERARSAAVAVVCTFVVGSALPPAPNLLRDTHRIGELIHHMTPAMRDRKGEAKEAWLKRSGQRARNTFVSLSVALSAGSAEQGPRSLAFVSRGAPSPADAGWRFSFSYQLWQFGNVGGDPPRLVAANSAMIDRLAHRLDEVGEMTGDQINAVAPPGEV